jgi:hypothetical protein
VEGVCFFYGTSDMDVPQFFFVQGSNISSPHSNHLGPVISISEEEDKDSSDNLEKSRNSLMMMSCVAWS